VLVDHEATGSHNGIYKVTQLGDASHPYILTRTTDADSGAELVNATVKISEGSTFADQEWQCTTNATITVGPTTTRCVSASVSGGVATVNVSGGGGASFSEQWWDHAVSGDATSVEFDVTGAEEIKILGNDLTNLSSVQRIVQVSVDGGATWFTTSGNYEEYGVTGDGDQSGESHRLERRNGNACGYNHRRNHPVPNPVKLCGNASDTDYTVPTAAFPRS
jgi:hypothetical protein